MRRLRCDDAGDRLFAQHRDPRTGQDLFVHPRVISERQHAVFPDLRHDQPDLVHMGVKQDLFRIFSAAFFYGDHRSVRRANDMASQCCQPLPDRFRNDFPARYGNMAAEPF